MPAKVVRTPSSPSFMTNVAGGILPVNVLSEGNVPAGSAFKVILLLSTKTAGVSLVSPVLIYVAVNFTSIVLFLNNPESEPA